MPRERIHVTSHPNGWQVKREGVKRASSVHKTQNEERSCRICSRASSQIQTIACFGVRSSFLVF